MGSSVCNREAVLVVVTSDSLFVDPTRLWSAPTSAKSLATVMLCSALVEVVEMGYLEFY